MYFIMNPPKLAVKTTPLLSFFFFFNEGGFPNKLGYIEFDLTDEHHKLIQAIVG